MDTKKAATKKAATKKASKKRKEELVEDPPIIVGGGGSTLVAQTFISIPRDTPKIVSIGAYDIYRVGFNIKTIVIKEKKNGSPKKGKPSGDGWDTGFYTTDV